MLERNCLLLFLYSNICELQADLNELRSSICNLLNQNTDIIPVVNRLNFAQCTYLLSVFRLETLRYFLKNSFILLEKIFFLNF